MNIKLRGNEVGELAIEDSAVRSAVELAIQDVGDGAAKVNQHFLLGSAIRVKEGQDKKLVVDLELNMPYDVFLPDAMREVQNSVKTALSKNLGIENTVVNVTVTKIVTQDAALGTVAAAEAAVSKVAAAGTAATKAAVAKVAAAGAAVANAVKSS